MHSADTNVFHPTEVTGGGRTGAQGVGNQLEATRPATASPPPPGPACPLAPPRKHHVPEGSHCSRNAAGSHSTAGWSLPAPRRAVPVPVAVRHHRPVGDRHDQVCVRGQAWLFVTFPCLSRYPKQLRAPGSSAGGWESDAKEADVPAGALCPPCRRRLRHRHPGLCVAGLRSSGAGPVAGPFASLVSWGVRRGLSGLAGSLGHGGV